MDTITHGIVGALAGKAFFAGRDTAAQSSSLNSDSMNLPGAGGGRAVAGSSPAARAAIVACTIGSIFPDIDTFAGPIARNPMAMIEWHRNVTHSVVMLPMWAVLLAAISMPLARWLRWETPSFFRLWLIYAVGLGTHIFLDVVTNFGTMVWSPLNYARPAWDWIFIIDLSFTAIALMPQLAAWCYRAPEKFVLRATGVSIALILGAYGAYFVSGLAGYPFPLWVAAVAGLLMMAIVVTPAVIRASSSGGIGYQWTRSSWCRAGLAGLCLYLGFAAMAHQAALGDTREFAAANHLEVKNLAALALPPTLNHWSGLVDTADGVWRTTFHVPGGKEQSRVLYSEMLSDPFIDRAKALHSVQVYLWFARFPLWHVERSNGETVVDITDVRFFRDGEDATVEAAGQEHSKEEAAKAAVGRAGPGFTFEVVFDANGRVVYQGFKLARL